MCTIKRAGRWGAFSPSAFYLLNIINDQSLYFTKVFRKHWCLTAVLQYLKMQKCCSYIKNLELACYQGLVWEVQLLIQESSVQDTFLNLFLYFSLSWVHLHWKVHPSCHLSQISGTDLVFPSFIHVLLMPLVPPPAQCHFPSLCLWCTSLGPPALGSLAGSSNLLLPTPFDCELLVIWWYWSFLLWFSEVYQKSPGEKYFFKKKASVRVMGGYCNLCRATVNHWAGNP